MLNSMCTWHNLILQDNDLYAVYMYVYQDGHYLNRAGIQATRKTQCHIVLNFGRS